MKPVQTLNPLPPFISGLHMTTRPFSLFCCVWRSAVDVSDNTQTPGWRQRRGYNTGTRTSQTQTRSKNELPRRPRTASGPGGAPAVQARRRGRRRALPWLAGQTWPSALHVPKDAGRRAPVLESSCLAATPTHVPSPERRSARPTLGKCPKRSAYKTTPMAQTSTL